VGRLGLTSPPSLVLCSATTANCPSRCPVLLARSSIPCSPSFSCPVSGSPARRVLSSAETRCFPAGGTPSTFVYKEAIGSPKFPGYPFERMPRSSTPVVSCTLALAHPGLLPSVKMKTSAFTSKKNLTLIQCPQLYKFRGSITRPVFLLPLASDSRYRACPQVSLLPCWISIRQVGLVRLSLTHPLGNTSQFHPCEGNPEAPDLTRHENTIVIAFVSIIKILRL